MAKALIGMSGGVDSSVTAYILKEQGYDCIGVTFSMFDKKDTLFGFDPSVAGKDIEDAKAVCDKVGIPFMTVDASEKFKKYVINDFITTYEHGGTPNPCIQCNRNVKFQLMYEIADKYGCDIIATGHYAKTDYDNNTGRYLIRKADDLTKDQSYMLYSLTQEQIARTVFPLAQITKDDARKIAIDNNFVNAKKSDSQDICFIPNGDYVEFIKKCTGKIYPNGKFIDTENNILGKHKGIINYTVGQRRGIDIALGKKMYVKSKNYIDNTVILAENNELYEKIIKLEKFNFVGLSDIETPIRCSVKIRYSQSQFDATVHKENDEIIIVFDEPQRAPTKGQSAVLYNGDIVLGGGIIK